FAAHSNGDCMYIPNTLTRPGCLQSVGIAPRNSNDLGSQNQSQPCAPQRRSAMLLKGFGCKAAGLAGDRMTDRIHPILLISLVSSFSAASADPQPEPTHAMSEPCHDQNVRRVVLALPGGCSSSDFVGGFRGRRGRCRV